MRRLIILAVVSICLAAFAVPTYMSFAHPLGVRAEVNCTLGNENMPFDAHNFRRNLNTYTFLTDGDNVEVEVPVAACIILYKK